jgi:hypothetical protein
MDNESESLSKLAFPQKLFYILNQTSKSLELSNILTWNDGGESFTVHSLDKFQQLILPKYFRRKFFFF